MISTRHDLSREENAQSVKKGLPLHQELQHTKFSHPSRRNDFAEEAIAQYTPSPRRKIDAAGRISNIKDLPVLPDSSSSSGRMSNSDDSSPLGSLSSSSGPPPLVDIKKESIESASIGGNFLRKRRNKKMISFTSREDTSHHTTSSSSLLDEAEQKYFARSENRSVRSLKALVMLVLVLVATAVCVAVYSLTNEGQQDEFEASFAGSAAKVTKSFEDILEQKIASIAAFGVTLTAYALDTNSTWPFVTLPNFQQRSASSRSLSESLFHNVLPIVREEQRLEWEAYVSANDEWIFEARQIQTRNGVAKIFGDIEYTDGDGVRDQTVISSKIFDFDFETVAFYLDNGPGPYAPLWQSSPVFPAPRDLVNFNGLNHKSYGPYINASMTTGQIALGALDMGPPGGMNHPHVNTFGFAHLLSAAAGRSVNYTGEPFSSIFVPIMNTFDTSNTTNDDRSRQPVAILTSIIRWASYFENILTDKDLDQPLHVVLANSCQNPVTYEIRGETATFLGEGNHADPKYSPLMVQSDLDGSKLVIEPDTVALTVNQNLCNYTLRVYPTQEGDDHYNDRFPIHISLIVAAVFVFTISIFVMYDGMVEKRQRKVLDTAKRSTAIVTSMFPRKVRDQLLQAPVQGNATKLRYFANEKEGQTTRSKYDFSSAQRDTKIVGTTLSSKPIADLFPDCTVMFADVEGFTAWSSVREPSQVFTFLEGIYSAFDVIAAQLAVFKVETVGDCYVAVCGLPEPRKDHAVVMARFACQCVTKHAETVQKLELELGPETGDLRIRIGLHSGPVTAGVLRGERSRFQIFGDTVNTASRLESSSHGNAIQLSSATARLIKTAGFISWIQPRDGPVNLKGKGSMSTFWLNTSSIRADVVSSSTRTIGSTNSWLRKNAPIPHIAAASFRKERLIAWNAELLLKFLKQIISSRDRDSAGHHTPLSWSDERTTPLAEVVEVIELPNKNTTTNRDKRGGKKKQEGLGDPSSIQIKPSIVRLVHDYVAQLAAMYHDNHFHNFEHASHVTMSVAKLLSRIVAPSDMDFLDGEQAKAHLHDHTYGITSDYLTQFACVLSALIHDVDHQGVSNATLIAEESNLVQLYGTKSLAEQNSVDLAWNLLMSPHYRPLVALLCRDPVEIKRFRQLVVNSAMATDIMDPDLKKLRNARWDKAFRNGSTQIAASSIEKQKQCTVNRKATIVIEHLIQASDVSHTMQHWNVYTKWNARLFKELYKAYIDGRPGAKDPSLFWAKGEIGFFDFYVIPLANKLKDCGVFGVSSDEYLNYAISNRNEWEAKGQSMVERLVAEVQEECSTPGKKDSLLLYDRSK